MSNPGDPDAELLRELAQSTDLDTPRTWVNYIYFNEKVSAKKAAAEVGRMPSWSMAEITMERSRPGWLIRIEQSEVVLSPAHVMAARHMLSGLARDNNGEYDGWEASL